MKKICLSILLFPFIVHAQSIVFGPGGIITSETVKINTLTNSTGLIHKSTNSELVTFVSDAIGGYGLIGTTTESKLFFCTNFNTQFPHLTLTTGNFAGIGITNPLSKLHVVGNVKVEGVKNVSNIITKDLRTDENGKLVPNQTYYYSIPRSAFTPILNSSSTSNPIAESPLGGLHFTVANALTNYDLFEAPINLPTGSRIIGININYIDNSASNFGFSLRGKAYGSENWIDHISVQSSGASAEIRSITNNEINEEIGVPINGSNVYYISVRAFNSNNNFAWNGPNLQIVSVKITYTY